MGDAPPDQVSLGLTCQHFTLRARLTQVVFGQSFWQARLVAVTDERDRLLMRMAHPEDDENSPAIRDHGGAAGRGDPGGTAEQQQQQADATRKRRQDRVRLCLTACQMQIQQRLGQQ